MPRAHRAAISLFLILLLTGVLCSCGGYDRSSSGTPGDNDDSNAENDNDSIAIDANDGNNTGDELGIFDLVIRDNANNHLSAYVSFTTNLDATAQLLIEGPNGKIHTSNRTTIPSTKHKLWALGMTAETDYKISVQAFAGNDKSTETVPRSFTTGPLPEEFPPIEVRVSKPEQMQPGYTLFNVMRVSKTLDPVYGLLIAVDETGRPVWYHQDFFLIEISQRFASGNLFYGIVHAFVKEIDMMGNLHGQWQAADLGLDTLHHELCELPSGNILSLSSEMRRIDGYLDWQGNPISFNVVGDVIAEFDRTGSVVHEWSLFDYIDPHRIKDGFHDPFWITRYGISDNPKDWTHANAVFLDPRDTTMLVSVRHQDWILKIDPATGDLVWRLGEGGDFTMIGDGQWQYHQHAPDLLPNGNLLIYDNGNFRPTLPFWQPDFTRVVEFAIDETAMTVEQVWEYRNDEPYHAPYLGSVQGLENGNVLIGDGGMVTNPWRPPYNQKQHEFARIVEVTHAMDPEKVFELVIDDPAGLEGYGYAVYRAYRIPSLYPPEP